jgi:hypothetical protein
MEKYPIQSGDKTGNFFSVLNKLGEQTEIVISHEDKFHGIKSFEVGKFNTIPHIHCDGISTIKILHQECQKEITSYPKFRGEGLNYDSKVDLFLGCMQECYLTNLRLPFRGHGFESNATDYKKIFSLSFTKKETSNILKLAKDKKTSVNFIISDAIDSIVKKDVKRSSWVIPLWTPPNKTTIKECKIFNNASFVDYTPRTEDNEEQRINLYKKQLAGFNAHYWNTSFQLLTSIKIIPIKLFALFSLHAFKRTGSISNLGAFEGEFTGTLIFAPPAITSAPLAIGVLTYNKELVLTFHSCPNQGPTESMINGYLKDIKTKLSQVYQETF